MVEGSRFEYEVRRSRRASRLSIRVTPGRVEVVLPWRAAERHAHEFAALNRAWIVRKLDEVEEKALNAPVEKPFPPTGELVEGGAEFVHRGDRKRLVVEFELIDRVQIEPGRIYRAHAPSDATSGDIEEALRTFLDAELEESFQECEDRFAPVLGVRSSGVRVREMKTMWGSCSPKGRITLNSQLSRLPGRIIEYTIAHELCHLRIRGHGENFWNLLGLLVPGSAECRRFLRNCR